MVSLFLNDWAVLIIGGAGRIEPRMALEVMLQQLKSRPPLEESPTPRPLLRCLTRVIPRYSPFQTSFRLNLPQILKEPGRCPQCTAQNWLVG